MVQQQVNVIAFLKMGANGLAHIIINGLVHIVIPGGGAKYSWKS